MLEINKVTSDRAEIDEKSVEMNPNDSGWRKLLMGCKPEKGPECEPIYKCNPDK